MNTTTKLNKVILSAAVMAAITGSVFAAGVNNTVDPAAAAYGAEAFGNSNTITATATSSLATGYNNTLSADNTFATGNNNVASGTNSIAGGEYAKAKGRNSLAIGSSAQALTDDTFAIGSQARTIGKGSIAVGNGANSSGENALSLGSSTKATDKMTTAVGYGSKAKTEYSTAVGYQNTASGNQSSAFGSDSEATGANAVVVGNHSTATADETFAAGFKSNATAESATAIGNQAEASGRHGLAIGTTATATATDAVAVGHGANAIAKNSVAIGSGNKSEGEAAVNIGSNNHGAYDHATIVGSENNIAYSDHMVDPYSDVVLGTKNNMQDSYFSIAVGNNNSLSNADNSVAIGNNTSVSVGESVAIGHESKADSVTGTSSASIGGTTYNFAGSTPVGTVSVGDVSKERTLTNVAAGRISDTSTDAVNGSQLHAVATEAAKHTVVTAGNNINVTSDTATNGGTKYTVALSNDLSVNSAAFGANIDPIHNVIDKNGVAVFNGDVDTHYNANGTSIEDRNTLDNAQYNLDGMVADSNGKHVEFTTTNITAGDQQIHGVTAGTASTDAVNMNQLTSALNQVNGNNNALSNMVKANHQEARKGIAGTAALAGLHPLDFDPDHKLDVMAGYGHFHGTNAGAVGIAYRPNEDLMFTVGSTFGSDNVINAGVSYKVGAKSEVSRSKATLIKDLDEAKKEIAQLKADNEKIKAILEKVLGEQAADLK